MSDLGFQHTAGSSGQGLTFIRPLPQGSHTSTLEGERSSVRQHVLSLTDRLFPTRSFDDSDSAPPVTGLELGHFLIEERIGRGGMGAVFRALDKRLDRVVALKILSPEHSSDPEAVQRFQNEARAAAKLDHDNIARVHYIGEEFGLHFIAFEFVTGTNIRNFILQKRRLSPVEAVNYTLQIAEALRHTAAANVVHRDIKPSNIIVSPSGRAKLVDLGLARHVNPDLSRDLTMAGTALGTFDYIAPEQALDARNVDVRSDIYSLGCTLFHMLTGAPPYPTGTMFEKVMNHHRPQTPDPATKNNRVSPQLSRVVQKMMASSPDDRYHTPEALISDLAVIAQELGLEPTPADNYIWTTPLSQKGRSAWDGTRTWTFVALILLLLILADRLRVDSSPRPSLSEQVSPTLGPEVSQLPSLASSLPEDNSSPITVPVPEIPASPPNTSSPSSTVFSPLIPPHPDMRDESTESTPETTDPGVFGWWWNHPTAHGRLPISLGNSLIQGLLKDPLLAKLPNADFPFVIASKQPDSKSTAAVANEPFVVVNPMTDERFPRGTLAAACAVAEDNWAIEIQTNGTVLLQQEELKIVDKRIKIRPGRNYQPGKDNRPILRFDLSSQLSMGSLSRTAEMIHIDHGALELYDVDVEMVVGVASISDWSMVTLVNGSRLTGQGLSLTVLNPSLNHVALISLPEMESSELGELMPDSMTSRRNVVELKESICRGQFDFVIQSVNQASSFTLQNSAVATSGCLFRIDGSNAYESADDAARTVSIMLDHVTAVSTNGLLIASSGEHGSLPPLELGIDDSVFRVDTLGQALVEISGHEDYELLRENLKVTDRRDPSFFQVTGPLCVIDSTTMLLPGLGRELTPEQFGTSSQFVTKENLVMLPLDFNPARFHTVQPSDLDLRPGDGNPAIGASGDLQNAGVNWQSPRLPLVLPMQDDDAVSSN